MIEVTARICLAVLALAMIPALYNIVRGPSVADRVVAADALTTYIMITIVLASVGSSTRDYLDAVVAMAVLGFFGTVAMSKYLIGGRPID